MAKIKNVEDLRNHVLETLEKLSRQEIDSAEAGVTGKLCEGAIAAVKVQLEYARMLNEQPIIPFMQDSHNGKAIEGELVKEKTLPDYSKDYKTDKKAHRY